MVNSSNGSGTKKIAGMEKIPKIPMRMFSLENTQKRMEKNLLG